MNTTHTHTTGVLMTLSTIRSHDFPIAWLLQGIFNVVARPITKSAKGK